MSAGIIARGGVLGGLLALATAGLSAQQQVNVTVSAVPNPVAPGGCTRIVADVRDELNRQLTLENGVALQWGSYEYASSNALDFEWKNTASGEFELCAKPTAAAVNTQVTATIKGMPYNGSTVVAVAGPPGAGAGAAPGAVPTAPATVPTQPYTAPPQTYSSPAPAYPPGTSPATPTTAATPPASPPTQAYAPPPPAVAPQPPVPQAAAAPAAPAAPPQVAATPVKNPGGFLKKIGSHLKQRAAEVKAETGASLTLAATQVVDTAFQTGSKLVSSTAAEATNTARMSIGGVGQKLMLAPQRGGAEADNLAVAIASGRAVLLEMRFAPNTAVLEPAARELVRRLAVELRQAMAATPTVQFVIEGHVDSDANGQVLSEHRAGAVKAALIGNGVDGRRLIALGYGATRGLQQGGPPVARVEVARAQ